jgi:diacylglycerol kinase
MRISRVDDASTTTVCVLVNCLLAAFYYCYKTVALILLIGSFLFVVFIELLQVVWAMLLSVHVGHFRL